MCVYVINKNKDIHSGFAYLMCIRKQMTDYLHFRNEYWIF